MLIIGIIAPHNVIQEKQNSVMASNTVLGTNTLLDVVQAQEDETDSKVKCTRYDRGWIWLFRFFNQLLYVVIAYQYLECADPITFNEALLVSPSRKHLSFLSKKCSKFAK